MFNGLPVWPAEILHSVAHGHSLPPGAREVISLAYHFDDRVAGDAGIHAEVVEAAADMHTRLSASEVDLSSLATLEAGLRNWLRTIDGHRLWADMVEQPTFALVGGWLLENYFYLSAAARHVSAAIAACPDPVIRRELLHHLEDEAEHGRLLKAGLGAAHSPVVVELCRPLPTTIAFIGYLRELASLDWKAYCLAIGYLQYSYAVSATRHADFYQAVGTKSPDTRPLLDAMRRHDSIDQNLGHEGEVTRLISLVRERHPLNQVTLARAAVLPQLAWSFLDGIRSHYTQGPSSLAQRIGWSCNRIAEW
jgi:hypothetical protein